MENTFVLAFLFLFHISPGGTYESHCTSGERLHTPREGHDVCIPCRRGTYMDVDNHTFRHCKPCTRIENREVEVLVSVCNSTHDAVILCTEGFYRRKAGNIMQEDRCEKCTECEFPARPCEGYYDTLCCPPNHDAVMTPDGVFVCKERPIVCGAGQFFRTSSEECLPCPAGTFMPDHGHTYKDCLKCGELSENNLTQAVITRPCTRTAPTLFGCKAGYFRDPTQVSLQIEVPCTPCRICNRSLEDCGMFHDAVCDGDEITTKQFHGARDAHTNNSQSNKNDSGLPSCTECFDTDYVWILQLIFFTLLFGTILTFTVIIYPINWGKLEEANGAYDIRHSPWFTIMSIIVLFIFQSVVTCLNTQPRFAYALTAVYTLMTLSILIVMANVKPVIAFVYATYKLKHD